MGSSCTSFAVVADTVNIHLACTLSITKTCPKNVDTSIGWYDLKATLKTQRMNYTDAESIHQTYAIHDYHVRGTKLCEVPPLFARESMSCIYDLAASLVDEDCCTYTHHCHLTGRFGSVWI